MNKLLSIEIDGVTVAFPGASPEVDCLGADVVKFDAEVGDAPYEFGDEIDNPKDATSKTARDRQIRLVLENEVSE